MSVRSVPSNTAAQPAAPPPPEGNKKKTSVYQDAAVGTFAGAVTVPVLKPMLHLKVIAQSDKMKFDRDPRTWYKGTTSFLLSLAPTIGLQNLTADFLGQWFNPMQSACLAGGATAPFVCATEGIMTQQKVLSDAAKKAAQAKFEAMKAAAAAKKAEAPKVMPVVPKWTLWNTSVHMAKTHGVNGFLGKALIPTTVREVGSTVSYKWAAPWLKAKIQARYPAVDPKTKQYSWRREFVAQTAAGFGAAGVVVLTTQAFDTAKQRFQEDLGSNQSVTRMIFRRGAYDGGGWRFLIVGTAVTGISFVIEKANNHLNK